MEKRCPRCGETKPVSAFSRHARRKDGLQAHCRACRAAQYRASYAVDPERYRQRSRRWYREHPTEIRAYRRARRRLQAIAGDAWKRAHPLVVKEHRARSVAKRKGVAVVKRLDYEAILSRDRGTCHICGETVDAAELEFDHVIPLSKGGAHSEENVRVAHGPCNRRKNATMLEKVTRWTT